MAEESLYKIIANSPTIPQLPEATNIFEDDYVVLYSAALQKAVKIKKSNVQFPTTSFVLGETINDFPNTGVTSSLYLENSTNKLYKWDGVNYQWLDAESVVENQIVEGVVDKAPSQDAVFDALALKVDAEEGKGLSTEDYTSLEKAKLAGLESAKFKGTYVSLAALQSAFPTTEEGSYAHVDGGVGNDAQVYIFDKDDSTWILQGGGTTSETAASIKTKYESNPDTNAFTDTEKTNVANNTTHGTRTDNPHQVTASQVGLGNVNNTSDADKPLSNASINVFNQHDTRITALEAEGGSIERYVDFASFPLEGFEDTLYVDEAENKAYLWDDFEGLYFGFGSADLTKESIETAVGFPLANDSEVVKQISVNGGTPKEPVNGLVDLLIEAGASNRIPKEIPNTTQYTFVAEDFTTKFLVFTGGVTINAILPENITDTSGEVQYITIGNTFVNFTTSGTATVTPQAGSLAKTAGDRSVGGIKMTATNDYSVYGHLEVEGGAASIPKEHEIEGTRIDNVAVTGTYNIDYNAASLWILTLTGATTLTESNIPSGTNTKAIELEIIGDFPLDVPTRWVKKPSSQNYLGTVKNSFLVSSHSTTRAVYSLENLA